MSTKTKTKEKPLSVQQEAERYAAEAKSEAAMAAGQGNKVGIARALKKVRDIIDTLDPIYKDMCDIFVAFTEPKERIEGFKHCVRSHFKEDAELMSEVHEKYRELLQEVLDRKRFYKATEDDADLKLHRARCTKTTHYVSFSRNG